MSKIEILDFNLTEDDCKEIEFYGSNDAGYYFKDYEFDSEIRDSKGNLAAIIHNNASEYIELENEED